MIDVIIEKSNHEIITEAIAAIVKSELDNQFSLSKDPLILDDTGDTDLDIDVYRNRFTPYSPEENIKPIVNIISKDFVFNQDFVVTSQGIITILVDIFNGSKIDDIESKSKNLKICMIVRRILMDQAYKVLKLSDIVNRRRVTMIQQETEYRSVLAGNESFSRITMEIEAGENNFNSSFDICNSIGINYILSPSNYGFKISITK